MRSQLPSRLALVAAFSVLTSACSHSGGTLPTQAQSAQGATSRSVMTYTPPKPPFPAQPATAEQRLEAAKAGWVPVTKTAPFTAGTALLLTDGSIFISNNEADWYRLIPDSKGNYVDGTWKAAATLPSGYGPLYFASAVLPDGKVIINGGEYNFGNQSETNLGAMYDPVQDKWTSVSAPSGWTRIGDASSVVLPDGTYMLGNCCSSNQAWLDEKTMKWTIVGTGKQDQNSEEGWTLLPDGKVLTADVFDAPNSELFTPAAKSWATAGNLTQDLQQGDEMGPQVLRQDHTLFIAGAVSASNFYNLSTKKWTQGPNFPSGLDSADGPAALMPNGNVLLPLSPGVYHAGVKWFVLKGSTLASIGGTPHDGTNSSYDLRLLVLPTGQILETDGSNDVEVYTPGGTPNSAIAPKISSVSATLTHGQTYAISGVRFNGVSQTNVYGDDAQMAGNYPLVQIVNTATGDVSYARSHDFSSMAVGSNGTVTAKFDVPAGIETGASQAIVVVNGISSAPVPVTVQ